MSQPMPHTLPDALTPIIAEAVAAFRADMTQKAHDYGMDAPCVLLHATAEYAGIPPWELWHAWSARHMVALRNLLHREHYAPPEETIQALTNRLHDLFGHCIVGLYLCHRDRALARGSLAASAAEEETLSGL